MSIILWKMVQTKPLILNNACGRAWIFSILHFSFPFFLGFFISIVLFAIPSFANKRKIKECLGKEKWCLQLKVF